MSAYCEDCGTRMCGGFCPNCDEEYFIADQYRELGEPVPQGIADSEREQIKKREIERRGSKPVRMFHETEKGIEYLLTR